jgi:hypothetical protein
MKKMNGHNTAIHAAIVAGPPPKPEPGKVVSPPADKAPLHAAIVAGPPQKLEPGKVMPPPADKAPVSPFPPKQAEQPPLRPAKGDDDLMSEEPSVPDRG